MTVTQSLKELAKQYGVQTSYEDVAKRRHTASADSLLRVLQVLGAPVERPSDAADALRYFTALQQSRLVEPVLVAWNGHLRQVEVRCPPAFVETTLTASIMFEDGDIKEWRWQPEELATQFGENGHARTSWSIVWPGRLPLGYHRMHVQLGDWTAESLVISAPRRLRTHSRRHPDRPWGVFAPLYALHDEHSWGTGGLREFGDFARWVREQGGTLVAALPLLASFFDQPHDVSPYAPASRLFWNELYVEVTRAAEFALCSEAQQLVASAGFQLRLADLRRTRETDLLGVMKCKRQVLELLAARFFQESGPRRDQFEQYCRTCEDLEHYARFRAACERWGRSWSRWPEEARNGSLPRDPECESARQYHLYVQWLAHEQLEELAHVAQTSGMTWYLDLPLGSHADGYDVWRYRDAFALGASGGAPPDSFFTKGQNWGFPPLHPHQLRDRRYDYFIRVLRHHLQQAQLLRIDHVMGLHRLFWVPEGMPADQGVYVRYPADEMHAILLLEAQRFNASIIGENLGTVPSYVNRAMHQHGLGRLYVVPFELDGLASSGRYRCPDADEVSSLNTHDMPTFAAWWQGFDIDDRVDLGLLTTEEADAERTRRSQLRDAVIELLHSQHDLETKSPDVLSVLRACLCWLARSEACVVLVNLEDLWLETAAQNTPGTVNERINWRRKTSQTLEQLRSSPEITRLLAQVHRYRQQAPERG